MRVGSRPDRGSSFIELLIAIVLLGTVVIGVLATVRVSVIGTRIERDHARAHQWLQSAIGELQATSRVACDETLLVTDPDPGGEGAIRTAYESALQAPSVLAPPGWSTNQLEIISPIQTWDGEQYWSPYDPSATKTCFDAAGYNLQLITLQVRNPDGDIIERVEVVKDE